MVYIVNEVDLIEKDPKIATDENHEEPFQSPTLFESRLPMTKIPDALKPKSDPLSGKRIMANTQTEEDLERERSKQDQLESDNPPLYKLDQELSTEETTSLSDIKKRVPSIGKHLQVSKALPKTEKGSLFNNLEFLFPDWQVESIRIGMTKRGCVGSVEVVYEDGLILRKGLPAAELTSKTLSNFQPAERITSAVIEAGTEVHDPSTTAAAVEDPRVLSYGVSVDKVDGGIRRLGLIWGDSATTKLSTSAASAAPVYDIDAASSEAMIDSMRAERDQARREAQALATAREERDQAIKSIEQARAQANRDMDQVRNDMRAMLAQTAENAKQIRLNGISSGRQSTTFRNDDFRVKPSDTAFLVFENGNQFKYQNDGNLVVYSRSGRVLWAMDIYGSDPGDMVFHGTNDGNLVGWKTTGGTHWASNTQDCRNGSLVLSSETPYIEIFTDSGVRRWHKP